jgi:hypothetical protein
MQLSLAIPVLLLLSLFLRRRHQAQLCVVCDELGYPEDCNHKDSTLLIMGLKELTFASDSSSKGSPGALVEPDIPVHRTAFDITAVDVTGYHMSRSVGMSTPRVLGANNTDRDNSYFNVLIQPIGRQHIITAYTHDLLSQR